MPACYRDEFATNSTWRLGAILQAQRIRRFYSVVVEDARSISFDGDTSLRRGFMSKKAVAVHVGAFYLVGAKAKSAGTPATNS